MPMNSRHRRPYSGTQRRLALAFDIGTTYSGVSYAVLDPGLVPEIQGITRYPSQQKVGGDSKIPSIVYYDKHGDVRAIGAEALQEAFIEQAEEEGFIKVEWFKLHLRPKTLSSPHIRDSDIPPLPPNKSAVTVLCDFLRYLYECARGYIRETHPGGPEFWARVEHSIDFVFSLPNGWEGSQQAQIRRAAVLAGLVSEHNSLSHVHFVTEGEASLHFCVNKGLMAEGIPRDAGVIVVDAGGGTIDISAYHALSSDTYEEIAPAQCRLQGSVFISRRAKEYLQEKLRGSRYASPEDVAHMVHVFDSTTKLTFRGGNTPSYIRFGSVRDRDLRVDIKAGQLKLPGNEVERLFQPPVDEIVKSIQDLRQSATKPITALFLVGGFAASDYIFNRLEEILSPSGLKVLRPDGHLNKAVADGAVSYYVDHLVTARVSPLTYGIECCIQYDATSPEHTRRAGTAGPRPSGRVVLPHLFRPILKKGTRVTEDKEFREEFYQEAIDLTGFKSVSTDILCYRGQSSEPKWLDSEPSMFTKLCTVVADTAQGAKSLNPQRNSTGRSYYAQTFFIIFLFGLTELKAQLGWVENGVERRLEESTTLYCKTSKMRISDCGWLEVDKDHQKHPILSAALLLDPGIVPEIKGVTRFPAQEGVGGDSKIPTIIYYDATGNVRAVGAEAAREGNDVIAQDEGWHQAEWFKLHLRSNSERAAQDPNENVPALPPGKTVIMVLADFLTYLFTCTKTYIIESNTNGPELWSSVEDTIEYVLTHPNGWEGVQQSQMREAAVQANLVPDFAAALARIHFVTEGEASLHFCLDQGLSGIDGGVVIVDAGGGTIDISAYKQRQESEKQVFEEITSPRCFFQGSIYVTQRAKGYLTDKLKGSRFANDLPYMVKHFDKSTKRTFRSESEAAFIKFGSMRDHDPKLGIRSGQLRLPGEEIANFFEPSIACIAGAVRELSIKENISAVFLVGGFGASDWVFGRLQHVFTPLGLNFCRPDTHVNKAVADGAISYYLGHAVTARVARFSYGIEISKAFDADNLEHLRRKQAGLSNTSPSGSVLLPKHFSVVLPKDTRVEEAAEYKKTYFRESHNDSDLYSVSLSLLRYHGTSRTPTWIDEEPEMYPTLCTISADTKHLKRVTRLEGEKTIYKIEFQFVLSFGLTELKAQLSWDEECNCTAFWEEFMVMVYDATVSN
ncbi:hypothetical protein BDN72DRAFT_881586 [Pluteus cervinus]|uniref:Uncharacterized protein n=1 Tax=Pluteus cervinus TaxID=181527 RepID=A0ACD3AFX4_9AGAR|nr:hypothetical protein BDN72DRAFT_881586 [Pluteus cervinus]